MRIAQTAPAFNPEYSPFSKDETSPPPLPNTDVILPARGVSRPPVSREARCTGRQSRRICFLNPFASVVQANSKSRSFVSLRMTNSPPKETKGACHSEEPVRAKKNLLLVKRPGREGKRCVFQVGAHCPSTLLRTGNTPLLQTHENTNIKTGAGTAPLHSLRDVGACPTRSPTRSPAELGTAESGSHGGRSGEVKRQPLVASQGEVR